MVLLHLYSSLVLTSVLLFLAHNDSKTNLGVFIQRRNNKNRITCTKQNLPVNMVLMGAGKLQNNQPALSTRNVLTLCKIELNNISLDFILLCVLSDPSF